ncbi:MAG: ThiF family adenylyltransferase [Flavobacteriales bacterium]|jgi:molybdopterin/thiamine biosynthesis adenylyltransferase/rhodanese-related sulfurtransferase
MRLSDKERTLFQRPMNLTGHGESGQIKLKSARILVIGLGGLGNPVAHYLAAAGIGHLTLVDFDVIESSNLHRQVLFGPADCGQPKAEVAAKKLSTLYPGTTFTAITARVDALTLKDMLPTVNLVADCTDNFETRYLIDDSLRGKGIPVVIGAVNQREGLLSLFHGKSGLCYRDAYPHPPESGRVGNCASEGISGPMVGIIGCMMSQCIIDFLLSGVSEADGKIVRFDGSDFSSYVAQIHQVSAKPKHSVEPKTLDAHELSALLRQKNPPVLIDVRETFEHDEFNIGGACMPAGDVRQWMGELTSDKVYVLYCSHGTSSFMTAYVLLQQRPELNVRHLKGGLEAFGQRNETSRVPPSRMR